MACDPFQEEGKPPDRCQSLTCDRNYQGRRCVDVVPVVFRRKMVLGAQEMCAQNAGRQSKVATDQIGA